MDRLNSILQQMQLSSSELSGQVVVVTGSGRGIGKQAARAFASLGAWVGVAELSAEGKETARQITAEGGQALFIQTDVADEGSVARLVEQTHAAFGPVDILVNNAILCPVAPVAELSAELFDRVIAVNLRGPFLTCKAFLPDLLTRGKGTILNLVSTDAMPGLAAYIASKQGLTGFTQSLAVEVGQQGIQVIAFGPGMVDTPAIRGVAPKLAPLLGFSEEQFLSMPLHPAYAGLMPAEDAGAAAAYLAAKLAGEYAGEMVTGYAVLERAGVISAAAAALPSTAPAAEAAPAQAMAPDAADLTERLIEILAATEEEFNQMPVFIRPLARNGFKGKAGQSLQDWKRSAARLEKVAAEDPARTRDLLGKLARYYQEVPAETARFTKDAEMLRQVQRVSEERVGAIEGLRKALEFAQGWKV